MSVALATLVPSLRRAVNPPGQQLVTAGQSEWVGRLADAFWRARLNDFFAGYVLDGNDTAIVPVSNGGDDLDRTMQQLIVQFAALEALRLRLMNLATATRQKAGPVEVETQRAATLLVQLLKDLTREMQDTKDVILETSNASPRAAAFFDSLVIANGRFAGDFYDVYGFVDA